MPLAEQQYRRTVNAVAFSMLVFFALFILQSGALYLIPVFASDLPAVTYNVTYNLAQAVLYALTFILPVLFYYRITRHTPIQRPIFLDLKLPKATPLYIFFGMAVVSAAAYLNSLLVSAFNYSAFNEFTAGGSEVAANYEVALMVLTTAVVPAFVEEFLFRGMVLTNLLPYGRVTAIAASAFLFGLMHQNAGQFFYATAAGVLLGWVYVRTRSIWPGVLLHFCNNFYSVIQTVLTQRLPEETADLVLYAIEIAVFALGIVSGVWLLLSERDRRAELRRTGAFEQVLPPSEDYAPVALPAARRVKGFFTAPMTVFVVLCTISMASVLLFVLYMF